MRTAARLWQGLDCMRAAYRRGVEHGFWLGGVTVIVVQVLVLLAIEAI